MQRSEQLEAVRAQLQASLQDMAEIIGPRACAHGDFDECEECTFDDTMPKPGMMVLEEFVLVMMWRSMDDNEWHAGMHMSPKQPIPRTNGLLTTALLEM